MIYQQAQLPAVVVTIFAVVRTSVLGGGFTDQHSGLCRPRYYTCIAWRQGTAWLASRRAPAHMYALHPGVVHLGIPPHPVLCLCRPSGVNNLGGASKDPGIDDVGVQPCTVGNSVGAGTRQPGPGHTSVLYHPKGAGSYDRRPNTCIRGGWYVRCVI